MAEWFPHGLTSKQDKLIVKSSLRCRECNDPLSFKPSFWQQCLCQSCCDRLVSVLCIFCGKACYGLNQNKCNDKCIGACWKCNHLLGFYGQPSACKYCKTISSFVDKQTCRHCWAAKRKNYPIHGCEDCMNEKYMFGKEQKKCYQCYEKAKLSISICENRTDSEPPKKKLKLSLNKM